MNSIALQQDKNGQFSLNYKNGMLVREANEVSFAKHNLLCQGRLNKNLTINPKLRSGSLGSTLENFELYSTAWIYFAEGNMSFEAMEKIIGEFNRACNRDFQAKLITQRIFLKSITKLDKNSLLFKIKFGNQEQEYTINI